MRFETFQLFIHLFPVILLGVWWVSHPCSVDNRELADEMTELVVTEHHGEHESGVRHLITVKTGHPLGVVRAARDGD